MHVRSAARAALRCCGLVKRYGSLLAVDGLDLELRTGECFGLLGPNGAGKTTTIEILEGLLTPDAGDVEVLGCRWGQSDHALRERLGMQLQETQLNEKLTVEETLRLFRSFYRRGRPVEEVIETLELGGKRHARVGKLSGGQRQRLSVACALVGAPELLFLDEPTTGLDPQSRRQLWALIGRFRAEGGTVLLTTHYMEEAHALGTCVTREVTVRHPLVELTLVRVKELLREPEMVFWVFVFPIVMALALGVAFRARSPVDVPIGVASSAGSEALQTAIAAAPGLAVRAVNPADVDRTLRDGAVHVVVIPGDPPTYVRSGTGRKSARAPAGRRRVAAGGRTARRVEGGR